MKKMMRWQGTQDGGAHAVFMSRILVLVLAFMLLPALAAGPSSRGVPKGNPRLASLQIEIWPEFDRPAALVILKGELAADIALPAVVSLRIAASSGGPSAVAFSAARGAKLFDLKYERKSKTADDFITLKFEVPERFFHVEFYDPLATRVPERDYTYVWPGDLATDRLSVIVQEPAAASNLTVQPKLGAVASGQDGLRYRSAELGALEAGRQLPIKVSYTKTDSRISSEILQLKTFDSPTVPSAGSGKGAFGWWAAILIVAGILVIGAGTAIAWWQWRGKTSEAPPSGAGFCSKCGTQPASGDRFCSKCGAPLQ